MDPSADSIHAFATLSPESRSVSPDARRAGLVRNSDGAPTSELRRRFANLLSARSEAAAPAGPAAHTVHDVEAFASTLADPSRLSNLYGMVAAVARRRYGLRTADVEDVFQDAVVVYLQVRGRYPATANHFGLFVGICHRTALTSLSAARRRVRSCERLAARLVDEQRASEPKDRPDGRALHVERDAAIRDAVAALSHDARDLLVGLADGARSRLRAIAVLGINRNTFDSRLHKARKALRLDLARRGGF